MTNHKATKSDFYRFLKKHRAYRRWCRNVTNEWKAIDRFWRALDLEMESCIDGSFRHINSPEYTEKSPDYWTELHRLWLRKIDKIEGRG